MALVPPGPSCSLKPLGMFWETVGMWILSSLVEQVLVLGCSRVLEQLFPVHRPFTAEIYRQKATRLHKRS